MRREIGPRRVGAADDGREAIERRIVDVVGAHDGVERAALADVAELDALDVIGSAADVGGDLGDVVRRHVDELRAGIDEAADEPRTGDAVDLRVLAGDPLVLGCIALAACRQALLFPAGNAAFEIGGLDAGVLQSLGDALADLVAVDAIDDHLAIFRQVGAPVRHRFRRPMNGADDHGLVGAEGFGTTNVHEHRRRCRAQTCIKFLRGNSRPCATSSTKRALRRAWTKGV